MWPDVTIVQSDDVTIVLSDITIVVPWQLATGSIYDYLVGIQFEVLRIKWLILHASTNCKLLDYMIWLLYLSDNK